MGMLRHILFRNVYKFPKYFTDINIKILLGVMAVFILIQLVLIIQSKKFILTFINKPCFNIDVRIYNIKL